MRKTGLGFLFVLVMVMTSCLDDDDHYSLGDIWVGFGVVKDLDGSTMEIVMDNGDVLVPVAWGNRSLDYDVYSDHAHKAIKNGSRVWVNYTILDDHVNADNTIGLYYVKVNSLEDVLMKGILDITPELEDSIGNDGIIVQKSWMSDSLLTFKLKYWGSYKIHFLNLVKQPGDINQADQPIQLELRHNANDDDEAIPYTAFVSFSLNSLRIDGQDSVRFEYTSIDYDGVEHSEEGVYVYGQLD